MDSIIVLESQQNEVPINPQRDPVAGDWVQITSGKRIIKKQWNEPVEAPEITLDLKARVGTDDFGYYVLANTSQDVEFQGTLTNGGSTINIDRIPVSFMDGNGQHVRNIFVKVVDGVATKIAKFNRDMDYKVNEFGINRDKTIIGQHIKLANELLIRVGDELI